MFFVTLRERGLAMSPLVFLWVVTIVLGLGAGLVVWKLIVKKVDFTKDAVIAGLGVGLFFGFMVCGLMWRIMIVSWVNRFPEQSMLVGPDDSIEVTTPNYIWRRNYDRLTNMIASLKGKQLSRGPHKLSSLSGSSIPSPKTQKSAIWSAICGTRSAVVPKSI